MGGSDNARSAENQQERLVTIGWLVEAPHPEDIHSEKRSETTSLQLSSSIDDSRKHPDGVENPQRPYADPLPSLVRRG